MTFPHYFHIFKHDIHPHLLLELIAYSGGFQLYLFTRKRWPRAAVGVEQNLWIIVGAIFGALFGSKILAWLESAPDYWAHRFDPQVILGGKTIVGGLIGGWVGVEISKKILHIRHSTGDAFVFPLIFGMAVGRIGCFLTGVADHTHGNPSNLPWAIDMGDGIRRHPTQLYDIAFLCALAIVLGIYSRAVGAGIGSRRPALSLSKLVRATARPRIFPVPETSGASLSLVPRMNEGLYQLNYAAQQSIPPARPNGRLFKFFLLGYVLWRFAVEFIKPRYTYAGLSAIQMACALAAFCLIWKIAADPARRPLPMEELQKNG